MNKHKKTITVIIILITALLMFASFFGVYKKNENGEKVSLLPNLKLGMEFGKKRVIKMSVNQGTQKTVYDSEGNVVTQEDGVEYKEEDGYKIVETPYNSDDIKTKENYIKTKQIIEKRLIGNNISEYTIDLNEETGEIKITIPENESADSVQSMLKNTGSMLLLDGETFEDVFDSTYLKRADVVYSQGDLQTAVFLQLTFNEEGVKKLEELSKIYVETTEEKVNDDGEKENVTTSKNVWVILNDNFLGQTILPNIVYDNKILFTFGTSNDNAELQTAAKQAQQEAVLLNSGTPNLLYDYSNETIESNITQQEELIYAVAIGIVFVIGYIYLIANYKAKGFISVYFQVGYLGALLLVLRLTNIILTTEGICGIIIAMILEFVFTYIVLRNLKTNEEGMYKKANLEFFLNSLPLYVIAVAFTFAQTSEINSFGMTLFWGILLIYVYNFIFTKFIYENLKRGGQNENH